MQALNDEQSSESERRRSQCVPGAICQLLLLLLPWRSWATRRNVRMIRSRVFGMVIAFSAVFALIADLDRPGQGRLEVNQQAMLDVQRSMRDMP
jgi:hypothetical protein